MRLMGIMEPLESSDKFKEVIQNLKSDITPVGVYGLGDSGRSYFINGIYENYNKPLLVVTHSDMEAKNLYEDLTLFHLDVFYLPAKEVVFYNVDAISGDLRWERLKVIREILNGNKKIVVTSVENLASLYTPRELYENHFIKLKVAKEYKLNDIAVSLVESGYESVNVVEGKGQFSLRGGILDIFPPQYGMPYRVEFFDDEIESIRSFNLESQRSISKVKEIEVFPAKEVVLSKELLKKAIEDIEEEFNEVKEKRKNEKEVCSKLDAIVKNNLELLKETWTFETIESYIPLLYEKPWDLFKYTEDYLIVMDDIQRCQGKLDSMYFEFSENYSAFLSRGDILPSQGKLLMEKDELYNCLQEREVITIDSLAKGREFLKPLSINNFIQLTLSDYQGQLDFLIEDIKDKKVKGYKTVILSGTRSRGERLVQTLRDRGIESSYRDDVKNIQFGEVVITFGNLLKGFEYPELKLCVISDKEVFGEAKRKVSRKVSKQKGIGKIKSFGELKPGDYVVHVNHGIGVYKGIKQIEVSGHKRDYLDILYDKGDKLYVPVDQLDMIQKYIGSEGKAPKVNKLGGTEWQKAKAKVRNSINDIADELIKLYASRAALKGYKFSKDTQWQRQFEDEFPFEETPDQITSLEEIKRDMESDKPMDRLLCGDVGYGKTEVAVRAAFKAVMDGKQVAFLVPTTILAEQHYTNMKKRFSDFPIKIDMISRFRTAKKQKETLKAVKEGNIDILIGTHRLVSKDITFKELGLLIVDEEQRFGVAQKEKIKNLKKNVDVLTLSATPIPRTLHMSLTGVRDISVIETPPEERYPIQTYVVEYNDQLIRDAIVRELNRGGQAFFVYNRVEDIEKMAKYLMELIPEAKVTVAHGQMTERELEKEMIAFMNKEYDILVCTTIIETGIDIPNVNTMIVYDSDKMGLSQLYQLRGRVGRSNRIAYAYFVYKKDKVLTEIAEKRLKALKDFTELGSGFKIAMRDLEIRGAGNMMGSAQHGHMASVGYDLYCRMLEDTIKLIKGEIDQEPVETTVDIKVDAFISENYIEDETQKIEVYKKIAAIENQEDYDDIKSELQDRYSKIPPEIFNLMDIAYIKSKAKELGVEEVKEKGDKISFVFQSRERTKLNIYRALLDNYRDRIYINLGDKPTFVYKINEGRKEIVLEELKELLDKVALS
ncbi:MAG: transcription-repair coupling factor [Clostridiaceae bacterium]